VLHVGDHLGMDVDGARNAGLHTAWLRRSGSESEGVPMPMPLPGDAACRDGVDGGRRHLVVPDLLVLADALGA
jgi:FMN hydrolase / 5-amino-6-(5-phospho-D-ribitylamino)uracil phosphatase